MPPAGPRFVRGDNYPDTGVYQSENYSKWLTCFHDNAKIRIFQTDAGTRVDVLKPRYKEYLEEGRASDMQYELVNPVIDIEGEKASLKYTNALFNQLRSRFTSLNIRAAGKLQDGIGPIEGNDFIYLCRICKKFDLKKTPILINVSAKLTDYKNL